MSDPVKLWFKVIRNGESCHGGSHKWSLPKQTADGVQPGDWHDIAEGVAPVLCDTGFHVTHEVAQWFGPGLDVYVAEVRGRTDGPRKGNGDATKIAAAGCRLLRPATSEELAAFGIYISGSHTARPGESFAYGGAKVTAYGGAQVTAYGGAQVTAYDSAKVTAYDNAKVTAYDIAQVTAYGGAQVIAYGGAQVTAHDSTQVAAYGIAKVTACVSAKVTAHDIAQVTAYGGAQVTAYDSAQVTAYGMTTVIVGWYASPSVTLNDRAAEVSWASGWAEFRRASGSPAADPAN